MSVNKSDWFNNALINYQKNKTLLQKKKTNFLITTAQQWQRQSFKVMNAQKLNVPVVDVSYISACLKKRKLLPTYLYAPIPAPTPSILQTSTETSENSTTPFCTNFSPFYYEK